MNVRLLLQLSAFLAVGGTCTWLAALLIGLSASSVAATIVLRTLLTLTLLALVTRWTVRRAYAEPGLDVAVALAGAVSYALAAPAWSGRALLGQFLVEPGLATVLIDLLLWVGIVVLAGRSVDPQPRPAVYQPVVLP